MKNKGESNTILNISKIIFVVILLLIQFFGVKLLYTGTKDFATYASSTFEFIKIVAVLYILYKHQNPSYKIAWIILILFLPVPGILMYVLFGNTKIPKSIQRRISQIAIKTKKTFKNDSSVKDKIKKDDKLIYNQFSFISNVTGYPVYNNKESEYMKSGEEYFSKMMEDISKAKKYILIEYFIIAKSKMWDIMFDKLKEKVNEGVKVYILYDHIGSMLRLPKKFKSNLKEAGIEFKVFNPLTPILTSYINYRDHRKITVIDGEIAYSGGINIGDEYINLDNRLGHWKDTGIRVTGDAVWSFVVMFFRMWEVYSKEPVDYKFFINNEKENNTKKSNGYIMPYCDGPDNDNNPGENVYINVINTAKNYVYITTPYLIIDNELVTALCNSAKSGVDIRIIVPGIPDKKFVYTVTRSFYDVLLKAGVKIYEYTPGFIHSKTFISDDNISIVGSINLDFRSLYLHYEVGTLTYKSNITKEMKNDYIETQNKCKKISLETWSKRNIFIRSIEAILRAFAPML